MEKEKFPVAELLFLAVGEAVVAVLTAAVALIIGRFDYTVATGALLGTVCVLANFVALSVAVNRAIDRALDERGEGELTDEEAAQFAKDQKAKVSLAIRSSYLLRTLTMIATLVIAFISKIFNPIATLIPFLCFRPLINLREILRKKK